MEMDAVRWNGFYGFFPRLKEREKQVAGTLSGGEQQMLAMGRALMSKPRLMMLDEPSMGLAPILVEQIFEIIQDMNKAGTTILLVEQNAQMALSVANRAYVMETGRITMEGDADDLMHDDNVRKAYLGQLIPGKEPPRAFPFPGNHKNTNQKKSGPPREQVKFVSPPPKFSPPQFLFVISAHRKALLSSVMPGEEKAQGFRT